MAGPSIRTDIIDVYVFRRAPALRGGAEFLQIHRVPTAAAMGGTWQTVMGHAEAGETAVQTALRELREETGFSPPGAAPAAGCAADERRRQLLGFWQLESLNTFFLASLDAVIMSPCFAAEVNPGADPVLDELHDGFRWVPRDHADRLFMWPGQRAAVEQIVRDILPEDSLAKSHLRVL